MSRVNRKRVINETKHFDDFDFNNLLIRLKSVEDSIGILASQLAETNNKLASLKRDHDNLVLNAGVDDF